MNRYLSAALVFLTLALTGLGLVMISSTGTTVAATHATAKLYRQLTWLAVALAAFGVTGWVDYKAWRPLAWPCFFVALVAMVLVHAPVIGVTIKGSARWIRAGPVQFQPSEFLRLAMALVLAHGLARHQTRLRDWRWGLLWPVGILAPAVILLLLESDLGTVALLLAATLATVYVAGARVRPLVGVGITGVVGLAAVMAAIPERLARWTAFLHPELYREGKGYQIWQSILALGTGGLEGVGLGKSRFKMMYLPEAATDAILPIIGEELGFYASIAVVLAYVLILVCGIFISMKARESYGLLLGFGLVFGLCMQAAINIGTFTGSMPPKGMPLPFISYGGSNLVLCYASVGLLVSIHRQSLRAHRLRGGVPSDEETPPV